MTIQHPHPTTTSGSGGYDLAFDRLYTPFIIKFAWFMTPLVLAVVYVAMVIAGFRASPAWGFGMLVVAGPFVFIAGMLLMRVVGELVLAFLRLCDDIYAMRLAESGEHPDA